ncbi:MAG: C25 family cysteine peptidase [Verrucomicrobia bacterium]|nr:C25 family cysteine peptidase [Verrucomicrobiota bacterium]
MIAPIRRALLTLSVAMLGAPLGGQSAPLPGEAVSGTNRLLVIARNVFHPALQEFVTHKQKLLPTELRSLESILQETKGADDPEKLKRFLHTQWRERGLGYVLLVGDVDVLPVRFMVLDRVTPAAFDYAFYPSDLYYSDLAKPDGAFEDWNARKEGFHANYFGEVRGEKNKTDPINYDEIHYLPEVAVGRWPVSTPEEARLVAAKTMAYEEMVLANSRPHPPRAAFVATGGWADSRPLMDELAAKLAGGWQLEKRYYSDAGRPSAGPAPNHEQVRGMLNEGVGLVVQTDHARTMRRFANC